ncbi:TATA-binding protein-associated factor mot1 [Fulvia fulva]|uniref:TATA-binding protein-associated factor mot1 n=1 Tax=Passalora fulva TaxID=5499 RepID=A0A9Q8L8G1_PASFU|nr:TATA-binding protein-associated factor mot1 [Fulvia fulva]KAK4635844.1 TATA-binding protein-associated factor mot1 [Fulvia fulva]UJO12783.1 TATA-binding protein-associated factor mot1 [Fulvia fulva]WPV09225.1 TATA-binding protein-associated factor mot1 [Fulvia fulva]WPV23056.1 TATA-binding protein-associated factor mot1 [Fulvia fulva]
MTTSRLDRLVTLLETGSTQLIRNTAAQQLADVQKNHPDELFNLLTRVVPYLRSPSWDTRTAAAKAIGGIVDHAEKYDPNATLDDVKPDLEANSNAVKTENGSAEASPEQLQLATLDVEAILTNGKELLGSAGKRYDFKLAGLTPAERLAHQKKTLTARLGLGGEYTEDDLVDEKDIAIRPSSFTTPALPRLDTDANQQSLDDATMKSPEDMPPQTPAGGEMSKRQLNMLKRRRKEELKRDNKKFKYDLGPQRGSTSVANTPIDDVKQEVKQENQENGNADYFSLERKGGDDDSKVVSEFKGAPIPEKSTLIADAEEDGNEWPFERLCEFLTVDLFDPQWEIRHGAAMGLREIVRVHGAGAGRLASKTQDENDALNRAWLDDMACRICCVFMLDRFADYVSDNAVAPIRETAGQVLGAVLQYLPASSVHEVNRILHRLVMQKDLKVTRRIWHACHGGMIGMRYMVAVRTDLLFQDRSLMDGVLECVIKGLGDQDDDVRSVSAATLIPVAKEFINVRLDELSHLISVVWECLSSLSDDLSASTGAVMDLLAKLCSFPEVLAAMKQNAATDPEQSFDELVPRLYPFLRHTITSVRSAVLRALLTFINIEGTDTKGWINGKALRLVYQNLLVERNDGVLKLSLDVWNALSDALAVRGPNAFKEEFEPHALPLAALTVHPIGISRHPIPMDATLFIKPSGQTYAPLASAHRQSPVNGSEPAKKRRKSDKKESSAPPPAPTTAHNIDAAIMQGDVDLVGTDVMMRTRIFATRAFGKALSLYPETDREPLFGLKLLPNLKSIYGTTQLFTAMVMEYYALNAKEKGPMFDVASAELRVLVEEDRPGWYSDLSSYLRIARAQCQQLLNTFQEAGTAGSKLPIVAVVCQGEPEAGKNAFSIADAEKIVTQDFEKLKKGLSTVQRMSAADNLHGAKRDAEHAIKEVQSAKAQADLRIRSSAAAALVAFQNIPKKPQFTIKALMDSVKEEENTDLQHRSATAISGLITQLVANERHKVVEKVVGNLVKFCCMETGETPEFHPNADKEAGILSLQKDEDIQDRPDAAQHEREVRAARITRRGAKDALEQLCHTFGPDVFVRVPKLQAIIAEPIRQCFTADLPQDISDPDMTLGQEAVDALSTLRALIATLDPSLHGWVLELLPYVGRALQCKLAVLRYIAAKCFASVCSVITVQGFTMLVEQVIPTISNAHEVVYRQGAIECIYHLIQVMGDGILPYVIFLLVPVLGRMSDPDSGVRLIATTAFATLVKLVPLEAGIPDPPGLPQALLEGRDRERKFIAQMLDPKKVEPFTIPVAIKAELRSYQQEGVNWLAFLNRYHLHGVLCDDMGLGKTLQTLCIVASDHHIRAEEFAKTQAPDMRRMPSLIVCPPTLTGHWKQEIRTYAPFLTAVAYAGPPSERGKVRDQLATADVVITSYDISRNDVDILAAINWNYLVLDEGHLIKNPKAKVTIAVKRLASNHRLILSGTPIQNNVLELWSLFDFLMPGFLGTEKVFQERFAKPIAASRFAKSSSKEQEAGALAVESLHKQVLPFLLRRLKEEVLNDLPPKILQNYYCDLSDLQKRLFDDFTKKEAKSLQDMAGNPDKEAKTHIFQALQYMRKLCNSPAMVMKEGHKQYAATQALLAKENSSIKDPKHAPKLTALRDLLVDCGIGADQGDSNAVPTADQAVSQHRALIFCQMKEMLDMVENTVLKKMLPGVTFSRMDGSVEASKRQDIVNRFNSDPSIDCLLLTTSVGGLGLNLTGADTVIFVEHDWNPQKDLQAMDRAHRIGQKKVVNVYRLVTRGTLEEKILNLQRFKIDVASTVVNQQNAGLGTMETDQILDLFNLGETDPNLSISDKPEANGVDESNAVDAEGNMREKGKKGILDELSELWDDKQYEEEFNLDGFLKTMKA